MWAQTPFWRDVAAAAPNILKLVTLLVWATLALATYADTGKTVALQKTAVAAVLDAFHRAAAQANYDAYFSSMTADVVFLGTDGTERWQGREFRDFVRSHFSSGKGWTYIPGKRNIDLSEDGSHAWFDEALHNEKLGSCRGSGILVRDGEHWKIAQYNLSVPIPNELVLDVATRITALQATRTGVTTAR